MTEMDAIRAEKNAWKIYEKARDAEQKAWKTYEKEMKRISDEFHGVPQAVIQMKPTKTTIQLYSHNPKENVEVRVTMPYFDGDTNDLAGPHGLVWNYVSLDKLFADEICDE